VSSDITIAAAELSHETNTFSKVPTDLQAFQRCGLRRGAEIRPALRDSATSFAGFFDGADRHGYLLVPILAVWATPSGMVAADALQTLVDDLVAAISASRPDGVLLALHGAMVSDLDDDGDGWVLERVRQTVGADVPIVATLDLHANISQRMVDNADVLIGYETYPHIDQRERANEASDVIVRLIRKEIKPTAVLVKPPMMPTSQRMTTNNEPMRSIMERAAEIKSRRGVLNVTVAGGFPPANTADTGLSVLVTTDNDPALAMSLARELADVAWQRRDQFLGGVASWDDAAEAIRGKPDGPVVLVDIGDNPWTGGPGDSAELLRFLLAEGVRDASLASIVDPPAVQRCVAAGPGATVRLVLGGQVDGRHAQPLEVEGYVRLISDGRYRNHGPMHAGVEVHLGQTVVLVVGGVEVLVTTYADTPIDLNVFRSHGIEPTTRQVIALKGKGHFRAAFEPIASRVVLVEGPGITGADLERLEFTKLTRPMWPIDTSVEWDSANSAV
jgi:microcystin degradation protein MlrC